MAGGIAPTIEAGNTVVENTTLATGAGNAVVEDTDRVAIIKATIPAV